MIKLGSFSRFMLTGLMLLAFVAVGYLFGAQRSQQTTWKSLFESPAFAGSPLSSRPFASPLDSASRSKSLSMATGVIQPGLEALYALDHLTGQLYCWTLHQRSGDVASVSTINVKQDMELTDDDADFAITTGFVDFSIQRSGGLAPANSVVYVGEGNSGKISAYSLMYDRQSLNPDTPVNFELRRIALVVTRDPSARRDQ